MLSERSIAPLSVVVVVGFFGELPLAVVFVELLLAEESFLFSSRIVSSKRPEKRRKL